MKSSIYFAADERKSNTEFDAVPLRQTLTKCSTILTKYCKLDERRKIGAKIFPHYTDIVIFVLVYFNLAHPVDSCL